MKTNRVGINETFLDLALELDGVPPLPPVSNETRITSLQKPEVKSWSLSSIFNSLINFIKRLLGFSTHRINLEETPKKSQIESFWKSVWNSDIGTIVSFSCHTADTSLGSIYWPIDPQNSVKFGQFSISFSKEEVEYGSQNQLLMKREFILEKGNKKRAITQLIAFPDATNETIAAAVSAAKKINQEKSLLALYTGKDSITKRFIDAYSSQTKN